MFKLDPPRPAQGNASPETEGVNAVHPAVATSSEELQGALPTPPLPLALGEPSNGAGSVTRKARQLAAGPDAQGWNDPFFRGRAGAVMRRWLAPLEGERGPRFWGAAAGVLVCWVLLRGVWAFGSEQPSTHWDRENRPQAFAGDGSGLAAMDVVAQRRPQEGGDKHWLVITGVVENQGDAPVLGARVAASLAQGGGPLVSWAGRWLHPSALSGTDASSALAKLQEAPADTILLPGQRLPFVLLGTNVAPHTPFQLHVAASTPDGNTP